MNDKMPPVAFRDAKPINRKERHPFTGEPTDARTEYLEPDSHRHAGDSALDIRTESPVKLEHPDWPTVEATDVLTLLRRKRDELDSAIRLIEQLLR